MCICFFEASEGLGRGEFYVDLANALVEQSNIQVNLILVSPARAKYLKRLHPKVRHVPLRSFCNRNNPLLYCELMRILKRECPDVVHTHFTKATIIYNRLSKWVHIPWLATKHNVRKGKIFEHIPNVVAVSKAVFDSVKRDDIEIINNGVDMIPSYRRPEIQPTPVRLIAIGRFVKLKGFAQLIRAVAEINQYLDCNLTIVGDGEEREALDTLIDELSLHNHVKLLGYREDIQFLINEHDALINSSENEGFGMTLLEGFYHAPVVISTPVGIAKDLLPPELILNSRNYTNQLRQLLSNYMRCFDYMERVRSQSGNRFKLRECAHQYLAYYEKLIKKSKS